MKIKVEKENIYDLIDIYYKCFSINSVCENEVKRIIDICSIQKSNIKTVLDLGCGTGCITVPLSFHFQQTFGLDKSQEAINITQKRKKLFHRDNLELIKGNWKQLKKHFPKESIDLIISWGNSLIYTASWEKNFVDFHLSSLEITKTINEVYSVLKPAGCFILQTISEEEVRRGGKFQKESCIYNKKVNHLLEWKIDFMSNKVRKNNAKRKVFSKAKKLLCMYETTFLGIAIAPSELEIIMYDAGFSLVRQIKDHKTEYEILIAKK